MVPEHNRRKRLLAEGRGFDAYQQGTPTLPLYGMLVAVKDVIQVEGFATRAGSALDPALFGSGEASVVTRLRDAGAVVFGKAQTSEFACSDPPSTANPRNLAHTPGGSSSGSAAAVAAGYVPAALGTQTVGSLIRPASYCGVVGFKPTFGRVPTDGVIPFSRSLDHVGVIASNVAIAELAARVICNDWVAGRRDENMRLLVPRGPLIDQLPEDSRISFEASLGCLDRSGFDIADSPAFEDLERLSDLCSALCSYEFAAYHQPWFADYGSLYRPGSAEVVIAGRGVRESTVEEARCEQARQRAKLERILAASGASAWVAPSTMGAAPKGLTDSGSPAMNLPWTFAGLPAVTVPAGRAEAGLRYGIQIVTPAHCDERALSLAASIEGVLDRKGAENRQ